MVAVVPAALSFSIDLPALGRLVFFAAAVVLFFLVRWALRGSLDVATFVVREHEARKLWQSTFADWEAKAGPHRFDDKRRRAREAQGLVDERRRPAAAPGPHRGRHPQGVRRICTRSPARPRSPAPRCARTVEETYELLLQTQLDLKTVSKKA